jgi:hypothetical protein
VLGEAEGSAVGEAVGVADGELLAGGVTGCGAQPAAIRTMSALDSAKRCNTEIVLL